MLLSGKHCFAICEVVQVATVCADATPAVPIMKADVNNAATIRCFMFPPFPSSSGDEKDDISIIVFQVRMSMT